MQNFKPWSRWFAWVALVVAVLGLLLAVFNLFVNTDRVGAWLPLLVVMPWPLVYAIASLRVHSRSNGSR